MKRASSAPSASGQPAAPAHGFFLEHDDVIVVHEHGERADAGPREDALIGTAGSHAPPLDLRPEEPSDIASRVLEGGT